MIWFALEFSGNGWGVEELLGKDGYVWRSFRDFRVALIVFNVDGCLESTIVFWVNNVYDGICIS